MSFGGFERGQSPSQPMAEINVTPLVDVMLVLLVIFIITAPLLANALRLDLPNVKAPPVVAQANAVRIAIDAEGKVFWNKDAVTTEELVARFNNAARAQTQPEIHLRADKAARYEAVATVLSLAQTAGLTKIGFVTEPKVDPNTASNTNAAKK